MKLVEKKCPNCGANLLFDKKDSEVICKYCKTGYEIERDNTDLIEDIINPDFFVLHRKVMKSINTGTIIITCFVFVFIFIIFIIMFLNIFPRIIG